MVHYENFRSCIPFGVDSRRHTAYEKMFKSTAIEKSIKMTEERGFTILDEVKAVGVEVKAVGNEIKVSNSLLKEVPHHPQDKQPHS